MEAVKKLDETERTVDESESEATDQFNPFTGLFSWAWGAGPAEPEKKPEDDKAATEKVLADTKAMLADIPAPRKIANSDGEAAPGLREVSDAFSSDEFSKRASLVNTSESTSKEGSATIPEENAGSVQGVSIDAGDLDDTFHTASDSESEFIPFDESESDRKNSFDLELSDSDKEVPDDMSSLGDNETIEEIVEDGADSYVEYELPSDDDLTEVTILEEQFANAVSMVPEKKELEVRKEVSCVTTNKATPSIVSEDATEYESDDSSWDSESDCSDDEEDTGDWERNFVYPKTIPSPTNSYSTVSLSFLADQVPTGVAAKVFTESLRILRPGGIIYVVDFNGSTVNRLPLMRQMLSRVHDPDETEDHELQTEELLKTNGFDQSLLDSQQIVRWYGIKTAEEE